MDNSVYVGDPNFNKYDTEATTISLFGTHQINDTLSFEGTARYRDNEAEYNQTWITFQGDGIPRLLPDGTAGFRTWSSSPGGSTQYAFDARLRASFDTGIISHEVLGGLNYQDVETFVERATLFRPTSFNIFNPVYDGAEVPTAAEFNAVRARSETQTVATDYYVTNQMVIDDMIVINAGIRLSSVDSEDALSDQKDEETPITLGVLYKSPIGLNPYMSYAESFRATVGTDVVTSKPLKPRKGEQREIGIKYQPTDSESYIVIAYFELEEDNLVEFIAGGRTQPGLKVETEGVEIEARLVWGNFDLDVDFRHLNADDINPQGVATTRPSLPEDAGSLWFNWEPSSQSLNGFKMGVGTRYASKNESNGISFVNGNNNRVVSDGYTVFDAMLGYVFNDIDMTLNVRNIADKEYQATCLSRGDCFPGEQRTVVGSIAKRF